MLNVDSAPAPPARATVCGCGCGQPLPVGRGVRLFQSGHDARWRATLRAAHADGRPARHPLTGEPTPALEIAAWLDERRGGGSFWRALLRSTPPGHAAA